jgi:hypothetical protein
LRADKLGGNALPALFSCLVIVHSAIPWRGSGRASAKESAWRGSLCFAASSRAGRSSDGSHHVFLSGRQRARLLSWSEFDSPRAGGLPPGPKALFLGGRNHFAERSRGGSGRRRSGGAAGASRGSAPRAGRGGRLWFRFRFPRGDFNDEGRRIHGLWLGQFDARLRDGERRRRRGRGRRSDGRLRRRRRQHCLWLAAKRAAGKHHRKKSGEEYLSFHGHTAMGRRIRKVVPFPGSLVKSIVPS